MQMWLKGGTGSLRLPVLPSSYSVTGQQMNTIVTVNGLGEVLLKGCMRSAFPVFFHWNMIRLTVHIVDFLLLPPVLN